MMLDIIGRQSDQFDATFAELRLKFGESAQLGGADRSEVLRMREEDDPAIADEFVEVDGSIGCVCVEVGGNRT